MPRGERSVERLQVDPSNYSDYNDLPLVTTGCDSYASWDPRFKHLSPFYTTAQLAEQIVTLLPKGRFDRDCHLIITGGESLLPGWQKQLPQLFESLLENGLSNVTFETNGTVRLLPVLRNYIQSHPDVEFFFSVSAKMPVSGEKWIKAVNPGAVSSYICADNVKLAFKFVVASEQDVEDVKRALLEYNANNIDVPVYLMPVGGVETSYFMNARAVAELAMKNGFRYSPRLQVDLWKNAWAT